MNKILFGTLLFTISFSVYPCNKRVNKNKVVVFVDTNASYKEAKAAKEAACARGEDFVVWPGGYTMTKEIGQANLDAKYYGILKKRYCSGARFDEARCQTETERFARASEKQKRMMNKYKETRLNREMVEKKIKDLALSNKAISSFAISGHDGGGSVYGTIGRINKSDILKSFNSAYVGKPHLADQLQSVFMWGCYTATPGEVLQWKGQLPNLKVMAGFHGIGPGNDKDSSHKYLKDILLKEKKLISQASVRGLESDIKRIDDLNQTLAGVYVGGSCGRGEDGEYYFHRYKKRVDGQTKYLNKFSRLKNAVNCRDSRIQSSLRSLKRSIDMYYEGYTRIPKETHGTELRSLYNRARSLSFCIDSDSRINPDRIAMLLFNHGVMENMEKLYGRTIKDAISDVASLKTSLHAGGSSSGTKPTTSDYTNVRKDLQALYDKIDGWGFAIYHVGDKGNVDDLKSKVKSALKHIPSSSYAGSRKMASTKYLLDQLLSSAGSRKGEVKAEIKKIRKFYNKVSSYTSKNPNEHNLARAVDSADLALKAYRSKSLKDLSRTEVKRMASAFDRIGALKIKTSHPHYKKIAKIKRASIIANRLMYNLDPSCMDFLDWHEAAPGHTPEVTCSF